MAVKSATTSLDLIIWPGLNVMSAGINGMVSVLLEFSTDVDTPDRACPWGVLTPANGLTRRLPGEVLDCD
jgi:hypothetical protein